MCLACASLYKYIQQQHSYFSVRLVFLHTYFYVWNLCIYRSVVRVYLKSRAKYCIFGCVCVIFIKEIRKKCVRCILPGNSMILIGMYIYINTYKQVDTCLYNYTKSISITTFYARYWKSVAQIYWKWKRREIHLTWIQMTVCFLLSYSYPVSILSAECGILEWYCILNTLLLLVIMRVDKMSKCLHN